MLEYSFKFGIFSDSKREMSSARNGGATDGDAIPPMTWHPSKNIDEYSLNGCHDNGTSSTRSNGTTWRAHRRSRYASDNHAAAGPAFPVTFKTAASYLVTKVQLRSTFSIHFKVGSITETGLLRRSARDVTSESLSKK